MERAKRLLRSQRFWDAVFWTGVVCIGLAMLAAIHFYVTT